MYLAVQRAPADNRKRLPEGYPWHCLELQDDVPCPRGREKMTIRELEQAKKDLQPEYERWKENIHAPHEEKIKKQQRINDEIVDRLDKLKYIENRYGLNEEEKKEKDLVLRERKASEAILEKIII